MPASLRLALLLLVPLGAIALVPSVGGIAAIMLALITFVAVVIDRYADRYLSGQDARDHFRRWFLVTVASASVLVVSPDLRLMALAWTASSLALHQLLTFFADRPQAQVAAHKKFLLSRLADVAIYAAVFLLARAFGTYEIDVVLARASALAVLPPAAIAAGYLLVAGIVLRTAQLPFHGWLIQVMEAPTPVSALLHAGVVNIGGFVLIRLASLVGALHGARVVLVVVGATTAALAALVAMTRVSVKVTLAWSTAAQMGFMLVECGLGAWELALLHLIAHSLYKAHAFLRSGSVVADHSVRVPSAHQPARAVRHWVVGLAAGSVLASATIAVTWPGATWRDSTALFAALTLALALTPLLVGRAGEIAWRQMLPRLALALLACVALAASHAALRTVAPATTPPSAWLAAFTLLVFATLLVLQIMIDVRPTGRLATRLYPLAFAGFHLDALFTRLTFRLWPPRVDARRVAAFPSSQGARRRAA